MPTRTTRGTPADPAIAWATASSPSPSVDTRTAAGWARADARNCSSRLARCSSTTGRASATAKRSRCQNTWG
eukprot:1895697-Lingulodinium_polyedra.AAC.1